MALNAHEQAVRKAVEKTQGEARLKAAQFRVERAQRALEAATSKIPALRDAVLEAEAELAKLKDPIA